MPEQFVVVVVKAPGSGSLVKLHLEPQFFVVAVLFGGAEQVEVAVGMLVLGQGLD